LTQHSYFNLACHGDIHGHVVSIDADKYTPSDNWLIPSGEIASVEGTPLDFRKPTAIGARIEETHEALKNGRGYDTNYVLNHKMGNLDVIARVSEPTTGRVLEVLTTEPGLEFYTGNNLDGTITGKGKQVYRKRAGLCLEPQHYPDSIHHPQFPTTVLKPGEVYRNTIIYRFPPPQ
jgi:aldose 1-epimerase